MDSSWEGEILDSIFKLGSETYVGAKWEHTRKPTAADLPTSLSPDAGSLISLYSEAVQGETSISHRGMINDV